MSRLKDSPTLADFQEYVLKTGRERGFDKLSALGRCLMLGEEVGELFKSVRECENIKGSFSSSLEDEVSDVFKQILAIANYFEIDLEKAFREKEAKDAGRW